MLHLVTFGGLALESVNEAVAPRLSAQRLAILAVLAAEGDRRVSRERMTGLFWPDTDEERARHSLRQALYTLRQEIGRELVRSDFALSLDASAITSDVVAFRAALARGDRPAAGRLVRGAFLDGFYLPGAAPFQRWVEEERARLHIEATSAIAALATEASAGHDLDGAVAWWRQLTTLDPLSGRFALGYLEALAARGDRVEALAFARAHAAVVHRELETEVDPEIQQLEARLRSNSTARPLAPFPTGAQDPPASSVVRPTASPSQSGSIAAVGVGASTGAGAAPTRRRLTRASFVAGGALAGAMAAYALGLFPTRNARASDSVPLSRAAVTTRSATAYRLYQEALRAYYSLDYAAAHRLIRAALEDDSTFAMAAYYDALLTDSPSSSAPGDRAIRLAARASERERLLVSVDLLTQRLGAPAAIAMAETLATRYPNDARALAAAAGTRQFAGDWAGAADALRRAVALDSAALDVDGPCYLCRDLSALADVYFWADSLPAAMRVAAQFAALRPDWPQPWGLTYWTAAKAGDSAVARAALRRFTAMHPSPRNVSDEVRVNLLLDSYGNTTRDLRPLLESPRKDDYYDSRWLELISLRNQGRLREARVLNETGTMAGIAAPLAAPLAPEVLNRGILALESGDAREAAAVFTRDWQQTTTAGLSPGLEARYRAWRATLAGMAIAATGDTLAVSRLADTVENWGQRSLYGRDRRAHHYLRGLVHVAAGRDDDAIREFRSAVYSPTLGFTRVNLELGRVLLRRNRSREAAAMVAPALRGEVDASNLYVTRTELHELLAQAYAQAGEPDSAAAHYRVVVRSWANADPEFRGRREAARAWLARHGQADRPLASR
jgi:DNA-binding SARP family transcriptional activator